MTKKEREVREAELHEKYGDVEVWVVKDELISKSINPPFTNKDAKVVIGNMTTPLRTFIRNTAEAMPRYKVELDPKYKQIITYVALVDKDSGDVFCTMRLGGDSRLVGQRSIGIGGHVEPPEDIYEAMYREIEEEVGVKGEGILTCAFSGYIYDNSTPVSSVHVGFAFVAKVNRGDVAVKETDKLSGEWVGMEKLKEYQEKGQLEGWSDILLDYVLLERYR